MDASVHGDEIRVGGDARQRFHDARGYGRPTAGNEIRLDPLEAAHLLYRGDLDTVDGMDFPAFLASQAAGFGATFLVYLDLRDRGFYLSPAREGWVDDPEGADLVVYPRGKGPGDGEVAYRVRVVGERTDISVETFEETVLAIVDEEGDLTYLEISAVEPEGATEVTVEEPVSGALLDDRVVVWDPPAVLHERAFYGKPLEGRAADYDALHLSLVEAAYLAARGVLELPDGRGVEALVDHGRAVEGDRFDRRLRAYTVLRDRHAVPKTGFKFGADFRVYREVTSADDPGHPEPLVRVVPADTAFSPRDLALDVRLAHGVRKRMVFALDAANEDTIRWRAVSRLTP